MAEPPPRIDESQHWEADSQARAGAPQRPRGGSSEPRPRGVVMGVAAGVVAVLLVALAAVLLLRHGSSGDAAAGPTVNPVSSDPTRVVDRWLDAMFVLRDPDEMIKYTCKREADPDEVAAAIDKAKKAERDAKDAKLAMKVSWSKPREVSRDEKTATVTSTLTVVVGDKTNKTAARFDLVFESGWKVCDAEMR